jgi:hypothetical protein
LTRWFHTGALEMMTISCGCPNANKYSQTWRIV